MPVSVANSFVVDKAVDYFRLSDLAYAEWIYLDGIWIPDPEQKNYATYHKLWSNMLDKGYSVVSYTNDSDTGYSGIIFEYIDGTKILANRGTELYPFYVDGKDLLADEMIARGNMPSEQFRSMAAFINQNIGVGNFEVTGHSLGGCLAQIAKAAYSSKVGDVYTYNSPGALNLTQTYFWVKDSENPGKVIITDYATPPVEWDVSVWAKYVNFFAQKDNVDGSKVYNVSGRLSPSMIANSGQDIGGEVFINGYNHSIGYMNDHITSGVYWIDPRKPVTVLGSNKDEVYIGNYNSQHYPGSTIGNLTLVGGYGNDTLWGADGNDLLYGDLPGEVEQNQTEKNRSGNGTGASGNDYLYGGKGNDTLYGGQGYDTYYYKNGDGNDRISDQGNSGAIIIGLENGPIRLGDFYKVGTGNAWMDASGQITFTDDTYWTITLPDSSTIQLEGLIEEGNFGFHFKNDPNKPVTSNVITTPKYDNYWEDTAGNDVIAAGSGNDDINAWHGGDDWLKGAEGSDVINSLWHVSNDVLEGGSGADLLSGGWGDDKVFSENYGEMDTLIADGEIAQSINEKGDSASGGWGNDYVYGSNRNDALFGGDGHDLIVGGGADDAIFGDDDVGIATRDWSFTITQGVNVTFTNLTLEYSTDPGDDEIYAGTGNDFVYAGGGDDNVYLGEGNDTGVGEGGYDFIDGDAGNDYLEGDASWVAVDDQGDDYIDGGTGNDTIFGGGGSDILYGGADNDRIEGDYSGTTGDDYIDGEGGADTLKGYGGDDIVFGGDGNDWIEGDSVAEGSGNDYLDGGAGNDTILGQAGDDEIYGGDDQNWLQGDAGNDYIVGGSNEDTILGGQGDDEIYGGDGVNNIQADAGNDYIVGGTGYDIITAGDGDDVVYGGDGSGDDIWGGVGNDEIFGGGGDDRIYGEAGDNVLFGDDGNDNITSGDGNDYVDGGTGNDLISAGNGANVLYGGDGNDAIFAGNGYDVLYGEAGDDQLSSGSGNDTLIGGEGNDLLQANGAGTKTLIGGTGDDTYEIQYEGASIVENAGEGNDTVQSWITYTLEEGANVENLTLMLDGAINATGNSQDNLLTGNSGANQLTGGGGSDTLKGWWGNDTLDGGAGNDSLYGGGYFFGGELSNQANGNDTYLFNLGSGQDVIFERDASYGNTDTIQLGAGISTSDVILRRIDDMYDSLEISIVGTTDKLTVRNYFDYGYTDEWMVEQIRFADSTVWDVATIKQMTLQGTTADELIQGYDTADLFHGQGGNDTLYGGDGDDTIYGDGGNDSLSGEAGTDTLLGGSGDDTYIIDDAADTVSESADEGTDAVQTTLTSYTLGANVENLTLLNPDYGSEGTGNALNNVLTGYTLNDTLTGLGGDDTLDGGTGSDSLIGGTGDDTYVINTAGDVITENAGEGTDTVRSSIAYTLGSTLENLTLTGTSGLAGTGNASNNVLIGNSGANLLTGNAGNDTLDGGAGNDTMRGGTNDDTYVVANTGDVVTENAGEGTDTVMSSISHTLGTNVENLTLTGSSNINATGNTVNNVLTGNSGANTLSGGTGSDTMIGGGGNDIYVVDAAGDVVTENADEGTDTVQTTLAYTLGANLENLTLTGSTGRSMAGNSLDNVLTGGSGADTLTGLDGNDTLDGGSGNDTMRGGLGNDTFVVGATGDVVTENAGEGTDTVRTSLAYTLGSNVENLTLTGSTGRSMAGNALDNVLTGGSGADTLTGNAGNDTLDGGAGNDTLRGGTNDDTYVVDSASDVVTENAGEGTDTVRSSISHTLGTNVENLTLTGSSNLNATGNTANNVLTGNSGANTLSGGTGSDTMIGGGGNDIYVVDAAGDVVMENAGEGTDTVQSSIGYTLGANVENLTLTGSSNLGGTGNALDNVLTGNTGANALAGGAGNDTYVVDNAGDTVTENADEGTDTVQSSIAYTLGANVENLTLTGSSNLGGTGNALDNVLTGNTGANALAGGAGNDTYVVDNAGDTVTENASEGADTVQSSIAYTLGSNVENLTLTGSSNLGGTGNALDNVLTGNTGANALAGGAGNDTYVVDNAGDVVTENADEGTDTVQSSIAYTLGANVENLTLTGGSAINGTGNALDNILTGNSAANSLDGGAGADTLIGGAGNDTYVVDAVGDVVTENSGEGTDTIQSSIAYTLGANVENLNLTGSTDIDGTGNTLDNVMTGNSGVNILDGGESNDTLDGAAGSDILIGGTENDVYVVDDGGDLVVEMANEGTDAIQSSITYTMGSNVENLTLTGGNAIDGTGNELNNSLTGNSAANTLNGNAGADTMTGGAGNDTYVVDNAGDVITEITGEGTDTVQSSIAYSLGDYIENLTLTGTAAVNGTGNSLNNYLTGNSAANILNGGYGVNHDTLDGGAGADTMIGGGGNDVYYIDNAGDWVTEYGMDGTDTVMSSISYTYLGSNIENLTLIGTDAINGSGNYNNNILTGNSAANTLNGGSGSDTMRGGAGDDVYVVEDAGDVVTENADEGTDTVQSSLSYTLGANVENLTLTGSSNLSGTGNALDNVLTGNTGANALAGGAGSDTYVVDNAGDTVTENADEGTDAIQSSVSYTLGANVENLTLTGSSNLNGTGNALNNILTGNSGANTLTGDAGNDTLDGGAGADGLAGGTGDDVYFVDSGDAITENVGEGTDTVRSSISYTLSANVENLILTGSGAADGTGNGQDNTLTGNEAANTLDGGTGADTLVGGAGNDAYLVDNAGDIVNESASEGTDTVQSSITYTLSANVENLTLAGSSNLGGTGNALDNVLTGNSGANALAGGAGSDTYVVDNAGDTVTENADEGSDTIQSSVSYTLSANVENLTLTGSSDLDGTGNALDNVLTGNGGANVLTGGAGNDTYMVDSASDVVTENVSEGVDTVVAAFAYTLGANVENLTLTGVGAVTGTGNALDNLLTGNGAANTLDGGAGADTLAGGAGDDIYSVDNAGDIVNESASEGTDTVQSSITYTLAANVENLTLTGGSNLDGTGNALDNLLTGNSGSNILTGGAGNDVYVVDNAGDAVTENADEGADTIQSSITYTLSANVENLILSGVNAIDGTGNTLDNTLIGNGAANTLTGGAGSDTLDGGAGADTLAGGAGNDVFIVDDAGDVVMENSGEGTDTVRSWVAYTLSAEVENLTLTGSSVIGGTGNTLDNVLTGNGAANTLTGNAGNDTLDGGAGGDALVGGTGNDIYIVDNAADAVTENADEGTDTVQSSITYTLAANVENLVLTGTGATNGTGNALGNALTGNGAANVLDGGAGADTLAGGTGNDTYIVDNAGDVVTENADEGTDTIQSSITYTLAANVENLTLTGGGTIDGTGNTLDNVLTGNGAANTLTGDAGTDTLDGAAGADTLAGGTGNDLYVVDSAGDVITESVDEGTDSVQSSITYTLSANVENLTLNGTGPINGTGNALDNMLTGDAWANTLTGDAGNDTLNGSASADTLVGGAGDDLYVVENAGDVVTENSGEGTDTVQSSVAFTLGAYVENLTLTGGDAVNGTGNSLDNVLTGNSGANGITAGVGSDTLQGGAGNDTLDGGTGSDTYVFSRTDGIDTISDYSTEPSDSDAINLNGIYDSEPVLVKQNNDLYIFIDENNYMKVADQFNQSDYGIERIAVTDGYYITRQDIENIIDTMSSINNDAGMDLIQKYNNMRNSELYVSTLAQSWQQ